MAMMVCSLCEPKKGVSGRRTRAAVARREGVLASILAELQTLEGRLDLALDRLAGALDPAPCGR